MSGLLSRTTILVAALAVPFSVSAFVHQIDTPTDISVVPITGTGIIGSASLEVDSVGEPAEESCSLVGSNGETRTVTASEIASTSPDLVQTQDGKLQITQSNDCCWVYMYGQWYCLSC